jgi:hypothetical protein
LACKTDVSKEFFTHLIQYEVKFRWDKKKPEGKRPVQSKTKAKKPRTPLRKKKIIPKEKPLSIKERKAVKNLAAGMTKGNALVLAGYSESTANHRPDVVFGKGRVIQAIKELMDDLGLTDSELLNTLKAGLKADKVISAMVIAPNGEGMKDANSMTRDFIEIADHDTRHKYLVTGLKLRGHLKEKVDVKHSIESYEERRKRLGLDAMTPEAAERALDEKWRQETGEDVGS